MGVLETARTAIKKRFEDYQTAIETNYSGDFKNFEVLAKFLLSVDENNSFVIKTDEIFIVDKDVMFDYFCDWLTELK